VSPGNLGKGKVNRPGVARGDKEKAWFSTERGGMLACRGDALLEGLKGTVEGTRGCGITRRVECQSPRASDVRAKSTLE